jgi:hypothetical protein
MVGDRKHIASTLTTLVVKKYLNPDEFKLERFLREDRPLLRVTRYLQSSVRVTGRSEHIRVSVYSGLKTAGQCGQWDSISRTRRSGLRSRASFLFSRSVKLSMSMERRSQSFRSSSFSLLELADLMLLHSS